MKEELILLNWNDDDDVENEASRIGMECSASVGRCLTRTVLPTAGIHSIIFKN